MKHLAKTQLAELLRVAFRTVDDITTHVIADLTGTLDRFEDLTRISMNEIAYRKGHHSHRRRRPRHRPTQHSQPKNYRRTRHETLLLESDPWARECRAS
ncbi:hypothetical protein MXD59_25530 [Frankia sp. Ag45/Mut15]|uniref:Transposase n=1 Tax=Frankia umida TaxID=573489 RepID=A0ABT0K5K6_9ACTN|nr:hypothetical protein [Frankia umida]MCK9879079.1 hypothetical protein [Frankia umida]